MLDFIVTSLISMLMGLGIGGGGLYISYLTLWQGISSSLARGTNLLFFVITSAASLAVHLRKRKIFPLLPKGSKSIGEKKIFRERTSHFAPAVV